LVVTTQLAWHFLEEDKRLAYHPHTPVVTGKWLSVELPLAMCSHGLHASKRLIDALRYAPGPILCRVELGGEIVEGDDKVVAQKRRVIAMADATPILHEMACLSAESVLDNIKDKKIRAAAEGAISAKRAWVAGKITDADLAAAESAARSAARSAAESAAWSAVESAAWSAAWSAARSAAESAARSAAESAARSAAWSAQNEVFTALANKLLGLT
jgi:hypothetical protein